MGETDYVYPLSCGHYLTITLSGAGLSPSDMQQSAASHVSQMIYCTACQRGAYALACTEGIHERGDE